MDGDIIESDDVPANDGAQDHFIFKDLHYLKNEESLNLDKDYITHMCGAKVTANQIKIGVALSNFTSSVYTIEDQISKIASLTHHSKPVSDIKFLPGDSRIIFTSSLDGKIVSSDSRHGYKSVREYIDSSISDLPKPLTTFDISCDGRFICAGTEVVDGNAYLTFWDTRATKLLGGYWQSHTDDITKVIFSKRDTNRMCSGSTDGLINIFDISRPCEDDALIQSLNSESSIDKLYWLEDDDGEEKKLGVFTHTSDMQFWKPDGSYPYLQFTRKKIATSFQLRLKNTMYLCDLFQTKENKPFIVGGSTAGKGELLRSVDLNGNRLIPSSHFPGNKQIVRTSWFDKESEVLITGGECCFLTVWSRGPVPSNHTFKNSKVHKRKGIASASKPY